ncbi:WD40 repeat-like protein [Canariomyces notabilis]|uniref:WD40 repeat-like protein n=1 Tax=Canariomyces notabilis TaxID=2074819 RepID=A0AAN6TCY1_9PEZI|nr:WD40 repeat-like protein [Canariomyces arenarius]
MSKVAAFLNDPPPIDDLPRFESIFKHGHQDLVQAVAFNGHGDRCATGSVDGKIRVFNRHKDGVWRHCDSWGAHAGEILELQWLPTTIYPNLLASLGIEGRFKLWAEDPSAAPGRRFSESTRNGPVVAIPPSSSGRANPTSSSSALPPPPGIGSPAPIPASSDGTIKPAFETRNPRSPYRSFSLKHVDDTRTTYLALVSADGELRVYENDRVENLATFTLLDQLSTTTTHGSEQQQQRVAARGEETSFRVRFDPNPDVCYTALRAGVPADALGLVVVVMDSLKVYRTRDTVRSALGVAAPGKGFYLAAEIRPGVHRGLIRDVAWAAGNIRGYDVLATACQDGYVRVFRLDTPPPERENGGSGGDTGEGDVDEKDGDEKREGMGDGSTRGAWSAARVTRHATRRRGDAEDSVVARASGIRAGLDQTRSDPERTNTGLPGQIRHVITEVSRLDSHRTPVWRVGFDDDGQILGSVGDEGKLMCYRQKPDGTWAKSTEMSMVKMKMAAP